MSFSVDALLRWRDSVTLDAACEQIEQLRDIGAFQGVHLVPVSRYREIALRLEGRL